MTRRALATAAERRVRNASHLQGDGRGMGSVATRPWISCQSAQSAWCNINRRSSGLDIERYRRMLMRNAPAVIDLAKADRGSLGDRKSTRLNSSHLVISYAVFCLK